MSETNLFYGPNAGYVLELFDRYRQNPDAVDAPTRAFFQRYQPDLPAQANGHISAATNGHVAVAPQAAAPSVDVQRLIFISAAAARLARFIRQRGHLGANIDPLHLTPPRDPGLDYAAHSLTREDLASLPPSVVGGTLAESSSNALEAIEKLRQVYSGSIGYEDEHIQIDEERYWLREAAESGRYFEGLDDAKKCDLLQRLIEVDLFEDFLDKNTNKEKRFSIEGTDMLVPMLDEIVHKAAQAGAAEVVMGMAHRGRLNVLTHVLGKPYATIFAEFRKSMATGEKASVAGAGTEGFSGDVKYHLGYRRAFKDAGVAEMPISLVPNPSHLEFVNAVAEGHARAAQERRSQAGAPDQDALVSLPILIHGDSAFPGQGIVAETLNLSRLPGYRTDGTIHIITNNQIGFTTLPGDARSTLYASDLAKGFEIPIVHVNADDPLACIAVARMAYAYREKFNKDFLIDLIGYRRYGHNEKDEPRYTQPRMYAVIDSHPRPRELWAAQMEREGVVPAAETAQMVAEVQERLRTAWATPPADDHHAEEREVAPTARRSRTLATGVPEARLIELNEQMLARPEGFTVNEKLERTFFSRRRPALTQENGIQWAHAEALAFASILADGVPIRLTGQDSERGTFGQRVLVLHDNATDARFVPLENIPAARASFAVYNSPLSENAALGFEYGYSIHAPGVLVLWEGQFGDFANGAQVILDQFIASGKAKWRQSPSLVLLLPHGYEGQGPEHSSARLERFLQLCAQDNMRVVNCTTAAQYFHLLRRQAALLESDPRPLVVMAPKSLLRDPNASSSLQELATGAFQPVIPDREAMARAEQVTRLILCSGKVYINLAFDRGRPREEFLRAENVAAVRVEELYPFPEEELQAVIAGFPNLREIVWMQEEPHNMGAWSYMSPRLRELILQMGWPGDLFYVGRADAASPAEGSLPRHEAEQNRIVMEALTAVPALPLRREPEPAKAK